MTTLQVNAAGGGTVSAHLAGIWQYRELIWMLTWRDIRVRYKHTALGAAWAVLPPLLMMAVFNFVFGSVADINRQGLTGHPTLPYSLFAFSGLVPWMFLANGLTSATTSLVANRQLVTKVYFPREVFPISAVLAAFVDFVVALGVLVGIAVYYHFNSAWDAEFRGAILFLPVVVLTQMAFMVGTGLILSMANLFYRDVSFLFRSVLQLWMFLTCVVYQLEGSGWKGVLVQLNPMTPIIRAYRDCLLLGRVPLNAAFCGAALVSLMLLIVGGAWFARREAKFAECV